MSITDAVTSYCIVIHLMLDFLSFMFPMITLVISYCKPYTIM